MPPIRISELQDPVNALKADWLVASSWIGFTPQGKGADAVAKCQSAINEQMGSGYIVEYITKHIDTPNKGFENDPEHLRERELHAENAGRLIAVHRLRHSPRPLREIIDDGPFERLQDMWATGAERRRWSVAFPIVESFDILDRPMADQVLSPDAHRRLIRHASATLRPFSGTDNAVLADLELKPRPAPNAWIAIEDEFKMAQASDIPDAVLKHIDRDLGLSAMEGMTAEQWAKVRRRSAWLANVFIQRRQKAGKLHCDQCPFDPANLPRLVGLGVRPRTLLDVHHLHPLEEGRRRTTTADFGLLCPTCHRVEHSILRAAGKSAI